MPENVPAAGGLRAALGRPRADLAHTACDREAEGWAGVTQEEGGWLFTAARGGTLGWALGTMCPFLPSSDPRGGAVQVLRLNGLSVRKGEDPVPCVSPVCVALHLGPEVRGS